MFAYAGSASFPTYQQDMKNKKDFPKAVLAAMSSECLLFDILTKLEFVMLSIF